MAVIMARVHAVHLMNAVSAPDGIYILVLAAFMPLVRLQRSRLRRSLPLQLSHLRRCLFAIYSVTADAVARTSPINPAREPGERCISSPSAKIEFGAF